MCIIKTVAKATVFYLFMFYIFYPNLFIDNRIEVYYYNNRTNICS